MRGWYTATLGRARMLRNFIDGPGPYYRLPGDAPGGAGKTLVSEAGGKIVWEAAGDSGLDARVDALESAVDAVEGAEQVNTDAISANVDAIAALASDVEDLADKQTLQGTAIAANRADIDYLLAQQPAADHYIYLNGASAYINFTAGGGDLLGLTKSWTVAIRFEGLPNNPVDDFPLITFGSGQVSLTLKRSAPPGGPVNSAPTTRPITIYTTPRGDTILTLGMPPARPRASSTHSTTQPRGRPTGFRRPRVEPTRGERSS